MYLVNSLHSGNNRFIFENNSLIIIKYRAKNRKSDRMIIRIRRAINYSGARERRWWRTREKGKERTGEERSARGWDGRWGRGGETARSAHRAKCSAAKAPALTLLRTPCASGPGGPSVRRRKQGTDRGPETIHVHLYNAVSFILPRLVIWSANEGVRVNVIVPIYTKWTE